jgi:CRP/FNR family transcriptional regulator
VFSILVRNEDGFESYPKGTVIFREGDKGEHMYAVRKGRVELSTAGTPLEVVEYGGIFGEMILVGRSERSATAIAQEECEVVPIDQKQFDRLIQLNPFLAREIMRTMADRLKAMNERLKPIS